MLEYQVLGTDYTVENATGKFFQLVVLHHTYVVLLVFPVAAVFAEMLLDDRLLRFATWPVSRLQTPEDAGSRSIHEIVLKLIFAI